MSELSAATEVSEEQPWSIRLVLRMIFHMLVHAVWISLMFPIAAIATILHPKSGGVWVARDLWTPFLIFMSRAKLHVEGVENVDPKRPTVYVCNHQSTFDIAVVLRALPVNFRFVAKRELQWVPILGWYLVLAGHILIDRKNRSRAISSLEQAAKRIRGGTSILMFAEGTRSEDGRILPFKKGPFQLALKAGVAVCPVTIEGTARLMPKNSWKTSDRYDVARTRCSTPAVRRRVTRWERKGAPANGSIGFGMRSVRGCSRVPCPPTRTTASTEARSFRPATRRGRRRQGGPRRSRPR